MGSPCQRSRTAAAAPPEGKWFISPLVFVVPAPQCLGPILASPTGRRGPENVHFVGKGTNRLLFDKNRSTGSLYGVPEWPPTSSAQYPIEQWPILDSRCPVAVYPSPWWSPKGATDQPDCDQGNRHCLVRATFGGLPVQYRCRRNPLSNCVNVIGLQLHRERETTVLLPSVTGGRYQVHQ